jgi:hypothetical protein
LNAGIGADSLAYGQNNIDGIETRHILADAKAERTNAFKNAYRARNFSARLTADSDFAKVDVDA